jgi:hypothetical protein
MTKNLTVAYRRAYFDLVGTTQATLLLSQLEYWYLDAGGPFHRSREEIASVTGLSRATQESALARLRANGYVETIRQGLPATLHYAVFMDRLVKDWSQVTGLRKSDHHSCKQLANQTKAKKQTRVRGSSRHLKLEDFDKTIEENPKEAVALEATEAPTQTYTQTYGRLMFEEEKPAPLEEILRALARLDAG